VKHGERGAAMCSELGEAGGKELNLSTAVATSAALASPRLFCSR
jgi:hypothetical protein